MKGTGRGGRTAVSGIRRRHQGGRRASLDWRGGM